MQYWLIKSEPACYSINDLKRDTVTSWTDVRNYQARNFLRAMKTGDPLLFYHSSCAEPAVVGVATVVREAYPDPTQIERHHDGYDARSTRDNPQWVTVDVSFKEIFSEPITLTLLKVDPYCTGMEVTRRGSRLSVQPVSAEHFTRVLQLGNKTS